MKKLISVIVLTALALPAFALMDSKDFSATVVGAATGTQSFVIRGSLEGVYITCPSGGTGTITIATAEQTLFTKSCTASAFYPILVPAYGSTGSALAGSVITYRSDGTTNSVGIQVDNLATTNAVGVYTKPAMAGSVTATFVGENGAAVTNTWSAKVLFNR